jgi:hypothetical protein
MFVNLFANLFYGDKILKVKPLHNSGFELVGVYGIISHHVFVSQTERL